MCTINYQRLLLTGIVCGVLIAIVASSGAGDQPKKNEDIWEQDLTDAFNIDASTNDIKQVNLKCGSNSMLVQLETNEDFTGVMYTRGSFYKQSEPCFVKPTHERGARSLEMRFPFDQCQTLQNGDVYSNVLVVQHDPELVTPGDAAFALECDFRKSRSLEVAADFQARDRDASGSRITLTSPDPSAINQHDHVKDDDTVYSDSDTVTFIPSKLDDNNKEQKVVGTIETIEVNEKHDEL